MGNLTLILINGCFQYRLQSIHESTVNRGMALRKERDERLQQMAKLQQDIANIPQEAVSEIVGNYSMGECDLPFLFIFLGQRTQSFLFGCPGKNVLTDTIL